MDDRTPPPEAQDKPASARPASVRPGTSGAPAALPDIDTGEIVVPDDDDDRATSPRGLDPVRPPAVQVLVTRALSSSPPVDVDDRPGPSTPLGRPDTGGSGGMRIVRRKIRKIGGSGEGSQEVPGGSIHPATEPPVSVPPEVSWLPEGPSGSASGPPDAFDTMEHEAATEIPPPEATLPAMGLSEAAEALATPLVPHDMEALRGEDPQRVSDLPPVLETAGEVDLGAFDEEPTREMKAVEAAQPASDWSDPEEGIVTAKVKAVSIPPAPPASAPPGPRIPSRPPPPHAASAPSGASGPAVSIPMPPAPSRPLVSAIAPAPLAPPPAPPPPPPAPPAAAPVLEARDDDHVEISLEDFAGEGPSDPSLALLDLLAELPPVPKEPEASRGSALPRGSSLPPPPPDAARASKTPPIPASLRTTVATTRGRRRLWWEELFNEDYFRTVAHPSPAQVLREADWIDHALGVEQGASVLDVGCGMGRQAVELARRGYSVVGLDYSPAMLARAADQARDLAVKPEFVQGDMATMEFEGRFDAAYCVGTSFGYFDDERNLEVVRRIHRALKPHGTFLLEVLNRDHAIQTQPAMSWFEGEGCLCMEETAFNYITSRLNVKRTMIFDDGRQRELEYGVRLFSLHELGQVLHQTGFRVVEVSGHPRTPRAFFGPSSRQLIILAQKRAQEEVLPGGEA